MDDQVAASFGQSGWLVRSNPLFVPNDIELHENRELRWRIPGQTARENWRQPKDRLLIQFVQLHKRTNDDIAKFAKRYGVFGLAEIKPDAPCLENEIPGLYNDSRWIVSRDWHQGFSLTSEPIAMWRILSEQFYAVLSIAAALAQSPPVVGAREQWAYLISDQDLVSAGLPDIEDAQSIIGDEVTRWLRVGRVGFSLQVKEWSTTTTKWETEIRIGGAYNLMGALAIQLMLTITGYALYMCSNCGHPAVSERSPKHGQRNYCDECRASGKPLVDADRARKARKRQAMELHAAGVPLREIQSRLGIRELSTVRRYVERGS
jgi:DNA-directed RNA polymerase subunit RPC12/RpoP